MRGEIVNNTRDLKSRKPLNRTAVKVRDSQKADQKSYDCDLQHWLTMLQSGRAESTVTKQSSVDDGPTLRTAEYKSGSAREAAFVSIHRSEHGRTADGRPRPADN